MTQINKSPAGSPIETPLRPARREWFCVFLLAAIFFSINLATCDKSPAVWTDEVMYADPAVNLYQGLGFTSGAWYAQPPGAFWAGNVPLYQFVLFGWLKLAGFSLASVRTFHYFALSLALIFFWLALWRLKLVASPFFRLAFCVILCCCSSVTFVYRSARPESLCLLLVAVFLLVCAFPSRPLRLLCSFLLGILLLWSGLQMAAYAFVLAFLLWAWEGRRPRSEMVWLGLGCVAGVALLYWFYASHGVWNDFLVSIRRHTVATGAGDLSTAVPIKGYGNLSRKLRQLPSLYLDYSFVPVFLLAVCLAWKKFRAGNFQCRSFLAFGIAASLFVPAALFVIGVYPIYYAWMNFLPLALVVCRELSTASSCNSNRLARAAIFGALLLACLFGLPRRLLVAAGEWQARSYAPVMALAKPYVGPEKTVYCSFAAYYAAKQESALVIVPSGVPGLTMDDRKKISIAIVPSGVPGIPESLAREFGGNWRDTGSALSPKSSPAVFGLHEQLGAQQYNLCVYERVATNHP